MIITSDYKFSSNVIEVIRPILNFYFLFFLQEDFTHTKSAKPLIANKKLKKRTKNIEKVIRPILNFIQKDYTHIKKTKPLLAN